MVLNVLKVVGGLLVAAMLVVAMLRGGASEGTAAEQAAHGVGYYGFFGFVILVCVAAIWDGLKKIKSRSKRTS